jgi:GTP-binding protein
VSGFVDRAQLHAKAGDGGAGAVSFRREAHVDRGGPDGGSGGSGGDVWVVASTNQASLLGFRDHPHRAAGDGAHGSSKRKTGASGADLEVPLPVGTVIRDHRSGEVLCDLSAAGDRWLAARGGRGGRGNATFLANRRRAPAFAEQGERGEERWLGLELKLVADVAIVGFPNVGKSTLISAISAARPKIADYPFTTLEPHLGVVRADGPAGQESDLIVADIPGLVEGAAEGRGLGHEFLRHVERARVLLVLVDLAATGGVEPARQLAVLLDELGRYQPDLLERPRVVVGSKADLVGDRPRSGAVATDLEISAATGEGVRGLVGRLAELVAGARAEAAEAAPAVVIHRPAGERVEALRLAPGVFELQGRAVERAVALSDLTDDAALDVVLGRLRRLGVDRVLARAGALDGDEVRVAGLSFSWFKDASSAVLAPAGDEARRRRGRR